MSGPSREPARGVGPRLGAERAPRRRGRTAGRNALAGLLAVLAVVVSLPGTGLRAQEPHPPPVRGARADAPAPIRSSDLRALEPRSIGPALTGGRIHDVEALPDHPSTLYVATASGGLWKSANRGQTWTSLFDTMAVSTFGDVAVAPSDPEVVYAGTGEQNNRQSTSWGHGVYRSDDGGRTWRHLGLEQTRHIGRVAVHPDDPDVAWVAALGNLWAGSEQRGVYRTTDGGETWRRVLAGPNPWTGAVDLALDPADPDVVYAALYQRLRRAWGFNGGGPGSGVYRSTDGGESWTELTEGLPSGEKGRIGLAVSRSEPGVLMALIEHATDEGTGTYRSEDGGESWERLNDLNPRPSYYSHIEIDPTDPEVVYVLATSAYRSEDGGRSFTEIATRATYDVGVHSDHHDVWIDPGDPDHLYLAGDAGLHESYDAGRTFRRIDNLPIGQFYGVAVDMRDPYRIYGGMQDNHSWMGPSRTRAWMGIAPGDWAQVGFGDGMTWNVDPTDHRNAYGSSQNGSYFRFDGATGESLPVGPLPTDPAETYRFEWVSPSHLSVHDPERLYVGGNRLFVSRDRGESWSRTRDLTRAADRDTLQLMGVEGSEIRFSKHDGTASYGEITTIAESPLDGDVLWVGTDDGNLQVSRDGGETWTEVSENVGGVTDGTYLSHVEASAAGAGTAYAAFDAHRDGDFAPYLFRTPDFGRSWEPLHGALPSGSVNVVREHPDDPDVLFLGTEHALFVSTDRGGTWARMPGLPTTLHEDLVVHPREKDLVVATHGRSLWIVDDTQPLVEWNRAVASAPLHLFGAGPARIFTYWKKTSYRGPAEFFGSNPPDGALLTYRIGPPVAGEDATLEVRGTDGRFVRRMRVPGDAGLHRIAWDLRYGLPGDSVEVWEPQGTERLPRSTERRGPFVVPGSYRVTVRAGGEARSRRLRVELDPALADRLTPTQLRDRKRYLLELLDLSERLRRGAAETGNGERTEELEAVREAVLDLYDAVNGQAVQPGSLRPPTTDQRSRKRRLEAEADDLLSGRGTAG